MIVKQLLVVLFFFCLQSAHGQPDTVVILKDTGAANMKDTTKHSTGGVLAVQDSNKTVLPQQENYNVLLKKLLADNKYLNSSAAPESILIIERKTQDKDVLFYAIFILLLLFGLLKMFYSRYLNNLFRVFFNTSLRQSQLTDQLLQAKLPSLFFNIFFLLTGGFYIYFLLNYLGHIDVANDLQILLACIGGLTGVYIVKYIVLKFTGWISGYKNAADTYIFIVFLINKIIAIALIPVIIIMAFSDMYLVKAVVLISYIIIFLMLILRFLRSYSILQNKIKVQRYHFFLYIIGIEILPLLLIYKTAMKLLTNNL